MLITVLVGDRSRKPIDQAFDDDAADTLGEALGVSDRSGIHALDLVLNVRDHRGVDRSRHVLHLLDVLAHRRLGDELGHVEDAIKASVQVGADGVPFGTVTAPAPRKTNHILLIVVGDLAAQALNLSGKRGDPSWSSFRSVKDVSAIVIPSASSQSRLWKQTALRRELLAKLELAFNAPDGESHRHVSQVLGNLLELGSKRIREKIRAFDMARHRHALGELYVRLRTFDWHPGQDYDVPTWIAKPQERLPPGKPDVINVESRSGG